MNEKNEFMKKKILFIRPHKSTFIQKDLDILKYFNVEVLYFNILEMGFLNIPLLTINMVKAVFWSDVTFSRLAGPHAFIAVLLSKIFNKKSIVVIGGFEVAKVPEIGYGGLLNPISAYTIKYVLKNADKILTVDKGLKVDAIQNAGVNGDNIQTVYNGFDYSFFKPNGIKENLIITVSNGNSWSRVQLKGLDTFVKSANFLPDVKFLLIGIEGDALKKLQGFSPKNVEFIESISPESLISFFQRAKVYCQLSIREGHPNALCEAMLCECVPVGTDVQGIRTAIGNSGFYVHYGNSKETAKVIEKALKSDKGTEARERIKNMFPLEKRKQELLEIIHELTYD